MTTNSSGFADAALNAMALIMMADGHGHDSEATAVRSEYENLTGAAVDRESLDTLCKQVGEDPSTGWGHVVTAELTDTEKQDIVRSCIRVCMADGELQDEEFALLGRISRAYGVHRATLRALMSEATSYAE